MLPALCIAIDLQHVLSRSSSSVRFKDGLAACVHSPRPQAVGRICLPHSWYRRRCAVHLFEATILLTPSRAAACGKSSSLNEGSTMVSDTTVLSKSPMFTASWLSTVMNLLSSSKIFSLLRSWRPFYHLSETVTTRLLLRQELERAQEVFGGAWARSTFASRRSVLFCVAKTPFNFLQSYWPPHAAHHQLLVAVAVPCRDPTDVVWVAMTAGAHVRQCDPLPALPLAR